MKNIDFKRPDKILLYGLKTLGTIGLNLYSSEKSHAKGTAELTFIGEKKTDEVKTQLYQYNSSEILSETKLERFDFLTAPSKKLIYWLNFHGLHDVELVRAAGQAASLDSITIRQIIDTTLRPKVEEYDHYIFFSVKSVLKDPTEGLKLEQLSFVLGKNYVLSFQEETSDHFDHIRNKMEENLGLLRKRGSDFLLCQLVDAILDNYFETIENINSEMTSLEKTVLTNPTQQTLLWLENLKQVAGVIKKSLTPFKDSLKVIQNRESFFIDKENRKYFVDLTNSCLSAIEEVEATKNSLDSLTNIYFSSLSQKMNETMKVLTTVATIFIPLTFIAGVYGMNFVNMPELNHPNGYFYTWGVMGLVFIGMIIYFKRKKWL